MPGCGLGLIAPGGGPAAIVANGRADIVLIGRAMLAEPAWPLRAAKALGAKVDWPVRYERANFV
ncbi:hypothetical protein [Elioraea sp.]|uniref:hypothetical protein n=1 Tax=Elioraea sp. TaxID=2185103 RepID=UPI0025B81C68|nr:hypothetical protein [Elioraea sp.]